MDDLVMSFVSVTGAGVDEARQMLEICDGNLEAAINMFLESGIGGDAPDNTSSAARSNLHKEQGSKRKYQQEEDEEVRAPIAPIRGRLVDDPYAFTLTANDIPTNVFEKKADAFRDFRAEANLTKADLEKQNTLALMFRPPLEIMFAGTFDQAREHGRDTRKWLLANIQKPDEFVCHTLNRDIWKDDAILKVVREHFVFWQINSDAPEGKRYMRFYPVDDYPYVAIVDARTGELVKKWTGFIEKKSFLADLKEFVEMHDMRIPQARDSKKQKALGDVDEDEQMRQAIALSMAEAAKSAAHSKTTVVLDSDEDTQHSEEGPQDPPRVKGNAPEQRATRERLTAGDPAPEPPADTPSADVTRLQIRLADGSRAVRRFLRSQDVQCLFDYVAFLIGRDSGFEVLLHKEKLSGRIGQSLQEAGVINAAVTVDTII